MNTVTILFGTESGNSEMVAEDIGKALEDSGLKNEVFGMEDYHLGDLQGQQLVILVASTYGEGDLPDTATPFFEALMTQRPDLTSTRFAAFGLGDSSYETYNQAIATLTQAFVELGATQIGETGQHDADSGLDACDIAVAWTDNVISSISPDRSR
jgi:MioC protein